MLLALLLALRDTNPHSTLRHRARGRLLWMCLGTSNYDEHFVCIVYDKTDTLFMEWLPTDHCAVYAHRKFLCKYRTINVL